MGSLPAPVCSKLLERYGNEYYQTSVCSMQGYRETMEDSSVVAISLPNHPNYGLFGIFDGHSGVYYLLTVHTFGKSYNYIHAIHVTRYNHMPNTQVPKRLIFYQKIYQMRLTN